MFEKKEPENKFGVWAKAAVSIEGRRISIAIDDGLPDGDEVIVKTNVEKAAALIASKVGGFLSGSSNLDSVKFFGE